MAKSLLSWVGLGYFIVNVSLVTMDTPHASFFLFRFSSPTLSLSLSLYRYLNDAIRHQLIRHKERHRDTGDTFVYNTSYSFRFFERQEDESVNEPCN